MLAGLDRAKFELFVYNSKDLSEKKDMSDMVDKWADIWKLNATQAAAVIMQDEVKHKTKSHVPYVQCHITKHLVAVLIESSRPNQAKLN